MRVDSPFADERERLSQTFDHRCEEEVAADLDQIGCGRLVANDEGSLADRVEQRLAAGDRWLSAGRDDKELGRRGGFGPAEHRRCDIDLASFAMGLSQPIGQRDADRAHRDMDGALAKRREPAAVTKHDFFDNRVLSEHGDDDRVAPRLGQALGDLRAIGDQCLRFFARAVIGCDVMAGFEKVPSHCLTHVAHADKANVHASLPHQALAGIDKSTATCAASRRPFYPAHPPLALSARYSWTKAIAMLPSPTAEATRFTGLNRTSPQANTPGTLVSTRYGSRLAAALGSRVLSPPLGNPK